MGRTRVVVGGTLLVGMAVGLWHFSATSTQPWNGSASLTRPSSGTPPCRTEHRVQETVWRGTGCTHDQVIRAVRDALGGQRSTTPP